MPALVLYPMIFVLAIAVPMAVNTLAYKRAYDGAVRFEKTDYRFVYCNNLDRACPPEDDRWVIAIWENGTSTRAQFTNGEWVTQWPVRFLTDEPPITWVEDTMGARP